MKIKPAVSVISPDCLKTGTVLTPDIKGGMHAEETLSLPHSFAYAPFINSHDHLVGNWFPRSGDNRPYPNSHIWVEDMRHSFAYEERNNFWVNDGSFRLTEPNAYTLVQLGAYKNLFSGTPTVHDHSPQQTDDYYDGLPITLVRKYRQCHSITLGNWWGGGTCEEEMTASKGKMPFIIHLAEGTDDISKTEFAKLKKRGILQSNTLIIHGIALTKTELKEIAAVGASVCWCPSSNFYLIGKTLDIESCLKYGVNVVLGTDSTQTGGINILDEYATAHEKFPAIPLQTLYAMFTVNAAKALFLPASKAILHPNKTSDLLLVDAIEHDPFENLLEISSEHIQLLLHNGLPLYGDAEWLERFDGIGTEYTEFRVGKREKFVIGDPLELNDRIDAVLGYHKDFPFLPF